jgi:hypothetical protein
MPGYGWVPFEPTPGAQLPAIYQPGAELTEGLGSSAIGDFDSDCFEEFIGACEDESLLDPELGEGGQTGGAGGPLGGFPAWLAAALAALAAGGTASFWAWKRYMAVSTVPADAYRRLSALAWMGALGHPGHQTPYQFGGRLVEALPEQRQRLSVVIDSYVRSRYGNKGPSPQEEARLAGAWRGLRFPLLRRIFWRGGL